MYVLFCIKKKKKFSLLMHTLICFTISCWRADVTLDVRTLLCRMHSVKLLVSNCMWASGII